MLYYLCLFIASYRLVEIKSFRIVGLTAWWQFLKEKKLSSYVYFLCWAFQVWQDYSRIIEVFVFQVSRSDAKLSRSKPVKASCLLFLFFLPLEDHNGVWQVHRGHLCCLHAWSADIPVCCEGPQNWWKPVHATHPYQCEWQSLYV